MRYSYEYKRKCVELYREGKWPETPEGRTAIRAVVEKLFSPQNMMAKMNLSAERILLMQTELEKPELRRGLSRQRSYAHACACSDILNPYLTCFHNSLQR